MDLPSRVALTALLSASAAGCSARSYTPAARSFPFETASAPSRGGTDVHATAAALRIPLEVDGEVGEVGVTHGVRDDLAVSGALGFLHLSGDSRALSGGTARLGVMWHGALDDIAGGVFGGLGGGSTPYGAWLSPEVGAVINGTGRWVRPLLVTSAFAAEPFSTSVYAFDQGSAGTWEGRLPRTFGAQALLGLELGTEALAVRLGVNVTKLAASATDVEPAHDTLMAGAGLGLRARL